MCRAGLFPWFEAERGGVDAIALAGGRRAVGKQVAQMRVALAAQHLGALHEEALVGFGGDVLFRRRRGKARPSRAGIEFVAGKEQLRSAARAAVHTRFVIVPIAPSEGALGTLLARYRELFGCQLALPFGVGLDDFLHLHSLPPLSIIGEHDDRDPWAGAARSRIWQPMLGSPRNRDQAREGERHDQKNAARNAARHLVLEPLHVTALSHLSKAVG